MFISLMVICSLDALKKSSKMEETRIKKEIVEVLQEPSYHQKQPSRGVLWKNVFLNVSQNSQKNICARIFF